MTRDFLEDFVTALETEEHQYVIVTVDKHNKDFFICHDVKDVSTFEDIMDILQSVKEGDIGGEEE